MVCHIKGQNVINKSALFFRKRRILCLSLLLLIGVNTGSLQAKENEPQALSLDQFVKLAAQHDAVFEAILLDQLPLKYRRDALFPDRDILLSIKQHYLVTLDNGHGQGQSKLMLSKLFTGNGSEVTIDYSKPTVIGSDTANLQFMVSLPIAKNAFGRSFQLQEQIIGIENDIIRHQVVEAYEDYLAAIIVAYYNWYSSYENLKLGKAALKSSQQLLQNILERKRQNIALPIDVNKMKLSLTSKQENLILLQETYSKNLNIIIKAIRRQDDSELIPQIPPTPVADLDFDKAYPSFVQNSRTYQFLGLLEKQGNLEVEKRADDLLPSTNLLLGYEVEGQAWGDRAKQDSVFAGVEFSLPLGHSVATANYEISRIAYRKTQLSNSNKYEELRVNLKNLYLQIQREQQLVDISLQKIKLSDAILKDESENYSYGKVTLNDYISAVNTADENRFSHTAHSVRLYQLLIEWQRLTDQLVEASSLPPPEMPRENN